MDITLKYSTSRKEISDWYWQVWRKKYWKYHVGVIAFVLFFVVFNNQPWSSEDYIKLLYGLLEGIGLVIFLMIFPQLMFKSKTRTLTFNEGGIRTTIGSKNASRAWEEVGSIEDAQGAIIITIKKTGNAFIVPQRAFQSEERRLNFLALIKDWHAKEV